MRSISTMSGRVDNLDFFGGGDKATPERDPLPQAQFAELLELWERRKGGIAPGRLRKAFKQVWHMHDHSTNMEALKWAIAIAPSWYTPEKVVGDWARWIDLLELDPWERWRQAGFGSNER